MVEMSFLLQNQFSLVKEKCVSECEVYAYDNMGHSEVLSLHPEKLCEIIRK